MARVPRRIVRDTQRELERLERQRDALDRAIARLRKVVRWLSGQGVPAIAGVPQGLTNVCRAALRTSPSGLTPREVKQFLTSNGFDSGRFTNPMSAIHTVLKRLVRQNEAAAVVGEDGEKRFVWLRAQQQAGMPSQAEEASRIEHLLDGTITWAGEIKRRSRRSTAGRSNRAALRNRT